MCSLKMHFWEGNIYYFEILTISHCVSPYNIVKYCREIYCALAYSYFNVMTIIYGNITQPY